MSAGMKLCVVLPSLHPPTNPLWLQKSPFSPWPHQWVWMENYTAAWFGDDEPCPAVMRRRARRWLCDAARGRGWDLTSRRDWLCRPCRLAEEDTRDGPTSVTPTGDHSAVAEHFLVPWKNSPVDRSSPDKETSRPTLFPGTSDPLRRSERLSLVPENHDKKCVLLGKKFSSMEVMNWTWVDRFVWGINPTFIKTWSGIAIFVTTVLRERTLWDYLSAYCSFIIKIKVSDVLLFQIIQ